MTTKTKLEKKILREIHDLQESDVVKIFKVVHFIKEELIEKKVKKSKDDILRYAGMLKDLPKKELEIFHQTTKRRNLFGGRSVSI